MDLSRVNESLATDLKRAMAAVVDGSLFLKGPATQAFEQAWAAYCGVGFCLGVANGTDALELTLRAIGAAGREVILAANAGGYATAACRLIGAVPVYADIDPLTHVIAPEAALELLAPATRVIVATHLYGNLADVAAIRAGLTLRGRSDVRVVEDCAQAHGLCATEGRVGSLGDAATFSFYPTKNLGALGDGGAITTDDAALFEEIKALHQYGWTSRYRAERPFGRNSRLDEMQAAVLLVKFPHLEQWNDQRRGIVGRYRDALPRFKFISGIGPTVAHLCILQVTARETFRRTLRTCGIGTDVHYPTLDCDQPAQQGLSFRSDELTVSRQAVQRIVTLPCFPGMTGDEIDRVIEASQHAHAVADDE